MAIEPTIETLRILAKQAGLDMTDAELEAVTPGVRRNLAMSETVRKWAALGTEPATATLKPKQKG